MLISDRVARLITWFLLVLALGGCGVGSSSPSAPASSAPSASGPISGLTDCGTIDLRTPSGERIDLSGSWTGGSTIHYIRHIGTCVWWEAVSNLPGSPLGSYWRNVFHGSVSADFTLTGDWSDIYNDDSFRQGGLEMGWVQFRITVETDGGDETIVLVRDVTRGDQYRPEMLTRIDMPEWPIAPSP